MSCAYRACVRPVLTHGVCGDHLLVTLEAGRRAATYYSRQRMAAHLNARYGAVRSAAA